MLRLPALFLCAAATGSLGAAPPTSGATDDCLACHEEATPGIVADWRRSRHAKTTPAMALQRPEPERRISVSTPPEGSGEVVVGCAECHTIDASRHGTDSWDHEGYTVHTVVSSADCGTCHPEEAEQYSRSLLSRAHGNLMNNPVFRDLTNQATGLQHVGRRGLIVTEPSEDTLADSCLACHGTRVEMVGLETRETALGELELPILEGWPNQGVGRINPDGSKGACTACHARHEFSIAMARKPQTCGQCHTGPDTPASKIYKVSKHGNIYDSRSSTWDFDAVPWKVGEHFTAPTCAVCHMAELTDPSGTVIVQRTHALTDRLPFRLFGLPYATAHPKSPDTTIIRNADGHPLPATLSGTPATDFLIDETEVARREQTMKKVCRSCHSTGWVDSHFQRLRATIEETNANTATATQLVQQAWSRGLALGLDQGDSPFNEPIERMWVNSWLLYANTIRMSSAMVGADYGVFSGGRWQATENLQRMHEWVREKTRAAAQSGER